MDSFNSLWSNFGTEFIYKVLPLSPFTQYLETFSQIPYLGVLNWFFPIKQALAVMALWLTVITTYISYAWILRWLKVVNG